MAHPTPDRPASAMDGNSGATLSCAGSGGEGIATHGVLKGGMAISYLSNDIPIRKGFGMAASHKRTFGLPGEQASYIDSLVASGAYASGSEVIRAGLRALQERDAAVERWLRDEVVPVAAAMHADSGRAIPADRIFDEIRGLHAPRSKKPETDA